MTSNYLNVFMFMCSIDRKQKPKRVSCLFVGFYNFFSFENKFISSHFDHHDLRPDVADGAAGIEAEAGVCGNAVALVYCWSLRVRPQCYLRENML